MVNDLAGAIRAQLPKGCGPASPVTIASVTLTGEQWGAILSALRRSAPADVAAMAVLLNAIAGDCDAGEDNAWESHEWEAVATDLRKAAALLTTLASGRDEPGKGEAIFTISVGGARSRMQTKANGLDPQTAINLAIGVLQAEAADAANCPLHSAHTPPQGDQQ